MRRLLLVGLAWAALANACAQQAATAAKPTVILFVGNSFTYGGNGRIVGLSTEALPTARGGTPENFVKNAILLEKAIHTARADTKVYLYEPWPYVYGRYPDNLANHSEPLVIMAEDILAGYRKAFTEDGHFEKVTPVGEAWMRAIRSGPATDDPRSPLKPGQIDLWEKDYKHPDAEGSYLAALTLYGAITGGDARKLGAGEQAAHNLGIAPEIAVQLQAFAAETLPIKLRPRTGSPTAGENFSKKPAGSHSFFSSPARRRMHRRPPDLCPCMSAPPPPDSPPSPPMMPPP